MMAPAVVAMPRVGYRISGAPWNYQGRHQPPTPPPCAIAAQATRQVNCTTAAAHSIWHEVSMHQATEHQAKKSAPKLATGIDGAISARPFTQQPLPSCVRVLQLVALQEHALTTRTMQRHKAKSEKAVRFAQTIGCPLNYTLTVAWETMEHADGCRDVFWLGLSPKERDGYLRRELGRICLREGFPWAAVWGRDIGHRVGAHAHNLMHVPTNKTAIMVEEIERITGAPSIVRPSATAKVAARSWGGGWDLRRNIRPDQMAGALDMATYIVDQPTKHPAPPKIEGKIFGITEAIGRAAQDRHRLAGHA
jgi:hypothetical protein